jgi:hypothetical protein
MRGRVNSGTMAEPFVYHDSPIVDPAGGHPLVGRLAPDAFVTTDQGRVRARSLFGAEHVVLAFADDQVAARRLADAWAAQLPDTPVQLVLVMAAGTQLGHLPGGVALAHDDDGELRAAYGIERAQCLLVRPDGHVAAAVGADAAVVAAAVARCTRALAPCGDARVRAAAEPALR